MPEIFPTPCINCQNQYICPDGIIDVRCIKTIDGTTLADYLVQIVAQLTGYSITEQSLPCNIPVTYTHNFNLEFPERIIVQLVNESTTMNVTDFQLSNYNANSVDITLLSNCSDLHTIIIK